MTNYSAGHYAEKSAAKYLKGLGFKILELNWKTRLCEIDIVAKSKKCIYFVEVKYRKNTSQGYAIDYVTDRKLKQMEFAAKMWVNEKDYQGEYALAVVGKDADVMELTKI